MDTINPLKQLYCDIIKILEETVVKYKGTADDIETVSMKREADEYMNAVLRQDKFRIYYEYDQKVIENVLSSMGENMDKDISETAKSYYYNRSEIPFKYRDMIVEKQREDIITKYIERNNYYRMLNGLPDIEESEIDYIYLDEETCKKYNLDPSIPIHNIDDDSISMLKSVGYMNKLYEKYPKKKYLKFLGYDKIDIVTARKAKNFSLLRIPYGVSEAMWNSFSAIYEQCREYFMSCIYITEHRKTIGYYDNFIAMCIMLMAIQQVVARVLLNTFQREFFDDYLVKILFEMYGVPYYSNMDTSIKTEIVHNLNLLIQNKGTNKVIYDLCSLFGYDRIKIYKYYLMKNQKFDINGFPVLKTTKDPLTGEKKPDYQSMYNIYFQKIPIDEFDVYKSLNNNNDKYSYIEITEPDPYWLEDEDLKKSIYEAEYNYIETKYMGVSIMYRMSMMLFENIYFIRMLFEKKDDIRGIMIDLPKVSLFSPIPLFDTIITLCAMVCKQNKLKGEILTKPSMILHVMGFNFNIDLSSIKHEILSNPYLDNSLTEFFKDTSAVTANKINNLYKNFLRLYNTLVDVMSSTQNKEIYQAYKKLYLTLFYCKESEHMFNVGTAENPVYAKTFMEYLKYTHLDIYEFIEDANPETLYTYVNHICAKLKAIIPSLKNLGNGLGNNSEVENILMNFIRFFKSYTTDLIDFNTIYLLDFKPDSLIRLIDHIDSMHVNLKPDADIKLSYMDNLTFISKDTYKTKLEFIDKISSSHIISMMFQSLTFLSTINRLHSNELMNDRFSFLDDLENIKRLLFEESSMQFKDFIDYIKNKLKITDNILIKDLFEIYSAIIINSEFRMIDDIDRISCFNNITDKFILRDFINTSTKIDTNDKLQLIQFITYSYNVYCISRVSFQKTCISSSASSEVVDMFEINPKINYIPNIYMNDKISFFYGKDIISNDKDILINSSYKFYDDAFSSKFNVVKNSFFIKDKCKIIR